MKTCNFAVNCTDVQKIKFFVQIFDLKSYKYLYSHNLKKYYV